MLFISRYVGGNSYGVVDTDDGVEEIVTYDIIQDVCVGKCVEIKGTSLSTTRLGLDLCSFVTNIRPFQPVETVTSLQMKMKMLRHVDITMYKDMITNICWRPDELPEPVVIRLSDFGKVCADCFLEENLKSSEHKVTLILDDKVYLMNHALRFRRDGEYADLSRFGIILDVREVTRPTLIKRVYSSLRYLFSSYGCTLIDNEERFEFMRRNFIGE